MKSRCVSDGLKKVGISGVSFGSWNCRVLSVIYGWDRLRERESWIEVGVVGAAAVASPPTGIQGELHEVGQPQLSAGSRGRAARQGAKGFQTHGIGAL